MKRALVLFFGLTILVCSCLPAKAMPISVLGGIRGGLALGFALNAPVSGQPKLKINGELELATGDHPVLIDFGLRYLLGEISYRYPISINAGLLAQSGNSAQAGLYANFIFERLFDIKPLYLETGVDLVDGGRFLLQVGYTLQ